MKTYSFLEYTLRYHQNYHWNLKIKNISFSSNNRSSKYLLIRILTSINTYVLIILTTLPILVELFQNVVSRELRERVFKNYEEESTLNEALSTDHQNRQLCMVGWLSSFNENAQNRGTGLVDHSIVLFSSVIFKLFTRENTTECSPSLGMIPFPAQG